MQQYRPLLDIQATCDYITGQRIHLPDAAGLYVFWWLGDRTELMASNRHIVLKGPGGKDVDVEWGDWWPSELKYPCLYVGKTTRLRKRFGQHLMRKSPGRANKPVPTDNRKQKPITTSCQLRYGIEHSFKHHHDPLSLIYKKVGFSFMTEFDGNPVTERFFGEDLLVGALRPWYNIDSER